YEGQRILMNGSSRIPTNLEPIKDPEGWNPDISSFGEIMGVAEARPPVPVGTKLWHALQPVQESLNQGSGTPGGLLDEAQRDVDPTMQQFCPVTLPEGDGEPDPNFDVRGED